jgi:outer membrane protein
MQEFRSTKNLLTAALVLGCAAAQAQTPPAQTPPVQQASASVAAPSSPPGNIVALPSKIAIIRLEQAVMATKEGLAAGAVLKAKYEPKQAELAKRQADIQTLKEQLQKGGATMSADAKDKLQRDIDSKVKSLQRDAQDANDDSQQDMGKVFNDLGEKMLQVIEPYAYQNGYAVVLDVSSQQTPVIWAAPATNITADIIKLYDQAHPGGAPAAAAPKPVQVLPKLPGSTQIKK